jgi:predicted phosphatase
MIIIKSENIKPFDVDGTLICDPKDSQMRAFIPDPIEPGRTIHVGINQSMVRLLKEEKSRGAYIILWSRGGYQWAATVARFLELDRHIDLVISKPLAYFDDVPAEEWLQNRVFIKPDVKYKR